MGQNFHLHESHVLCVSRFMNVLTRYSAEQRHVSQLRGGTSDLVIDDKLLSSARQVQALGGAFGDKYPLPSQTSCDYNMLFDDNLNVYVEVEERLLVTHAVEQEGATADHFISRSRKNKIARGATCRLSNASVGVKALKDLQG
jgi:hypothetical protein